ncbi:hypothetical protein [Actinoallomurus iriomotensis]|uniref:hypothetical protein n=1 Tax=Actinoallomurus iriomotensis TaxID=478107 RepID=UPI0025576D15|nr:hypothetical protein [Actinoallomurus iriomotensis]
MDSDADVETPEEEPAPERHRPPPDRPGAAGFPSRAESRRAASAANEISRQPAETTSESDEASSQATSEGTHTVEDDGLAGADVSKADYSSPGQAAESSTKDAPHVPSEESHDGLSDHAASTAGVNDDAVERGLFSGIKQAIARPDRGDEPQELTGIIDQPEFQDPHERPDMTPDRYGTPLDRSDGTRTPLFDGEPTREQAVQGTLGDCGIIATLGAVAAHLPEAIRDCVRETDDGNYEVRLHDTKFSTSSLCYEPTGRIVTLIVTPDLPVHDVLSHRPAFADSASTGAAWAPVLEKAIAGVDETWSPKRRQKWAERWDVIQPGKVPPTGYVRLNHGSHPNDRAELLTQLTGQPARSWEFPTGYDYRGRSPDQQLLDDFRSKITERKAVLVGSRDLRDSETRLPHKLHDGHAYEVTAVDAEGWIHLRNPYGHGHPEPMTAKQFRAVMRQRYTSLEE